MLPANVMSFMKKMVTTQSESGTTGAVTPEESGTTFSKLRQLGSGLMMVTGNVTKLAPAKVTPVEEIQPKEDAIEAIIKKPDGGSKISSGEECRVCRKSFGPEESSRTCCECQHKVCEDCASYSTTTNSNDQSSWRCSVCRRKIASRDQPILTQDSTDSLLEVPNIEALQRRHSEARLGSKSGSQIGGIGSGLAPPRSPELRRHSDVSTLKELEKFRKVAGDHRDELKWDREFGRKSKSRGGSPDRHQSDRGRTTSPQRVIKSSQPPVEPEMMGTGDMDEEEERRRRANRRDGSSGRRKSRVTRQRSYDDEIKTAGTVSGSTNQTPHPDTGLGLPVQLPRRASAYDVYTPPGSAGLNAAAIASAQQRTSISAQGAREPEDRPITRRSSFRGVKSILPYDVGGEEEKIINMDTTTVPVVPPTVTQPSVLIPDEERRSRRRGSQLPDINAIRALTSAPGSGKAAQPVVVSRVTAEERDLPRQGSLVDGEGIKIVIHDVDSDVVPRVNKVKLRRDPVLDKGHRITARGFGMRVVGGKTGTDGRSFAYIVWTVPNGPAEKAGLTQGDKVLEWSGVSLINKNFEEVSQIIDQTEDVAELLVEHSSDNLGDLLDDAGMISSGKTSGMNLLMETETDKTPSSPTRRKLPKTPEQIFKERQVTGRVQIQVSYENERKELIVSVFTADELCAREDTGYGTLPEAYAKLILTPAWYVQHQLRGDQITLKTMVAEPTQNPIWNATLLFPGVDGESLMNRAIEVSLWDYCPEGDNIFLGECTVELPKALENDRAVWYRLEDPRGLRSGKSPYCSPRGSLSMEVAQRFLRKTELRERSYSDDTQSDSGSPELGFLHPDHAWHVNSRRGSSQSEQLEVEPYELNRDYSRSLPGSRRSSFQSQCGTDSKRGSMGEADMPIVVHYNRDRRRSSCTRPMRDPEEILEGLRTLKAAKGELNRTMSLTGDKRRGSRRGERKESVMDIPERFLDRNSESDEDDRWSHARAENGFDWKLGRGQIPPKGIKMINGPQNGEVKLGFCFSKSTLEVEVICARDICPKEKDEPDTYVKTYLRDGERWLQKRKTRVIRHTRNPQYRQTLKYSTCDALGRNLLIMLWEKKQGFESNQGLGGAEVNLELLPLTQLTVGWYTLFPIHTLGTQTTDSP
ncbi:regulating synaptic membrane exocytosis protein 1 isoform X2 [Polistes fuscatus]|uniref:regulating synaptic membrane exocytosis protein 1 isoform X2 n=1 Tax=Polistes fuscatus TaxID=30207 RepID=UPI001CA8E1CB|nr:regulating synaptic membrane exocytosis protein 1 isoform X2 [Polistes fuscatus]